MLTKQTQSSNVRLMKTMTVRNVPTEPAQALDQERLRRGLSLNRTVLALLRNALCVPSVAVRSNGLRHLAGTWSEEEYRAFELAGAPFGEVDEAMWR